MPNTQPRLRSIPGTFLRFAAAGAVGTTAHYGTLIALVEGVACSPALAAACGALVGAAINYLLNYHVTFRSRRSHRSTLPRFALIAGSGVVANAAIVHLLVTVGAHYLVGQVIATAVVLMAGFVANRFWTFPESVGERFREF